MKTIAALTAPFLAPLLAMVSSPLMAQEANASSNGTYRTVETQSWVEEWDPAQGAWVKVADDDAGPQARALPTVVTTIVNGEVISQPRSAARYAQPVPAQRPAMALAQYGPFVVTGPTLARMVGSTDGMSPQHFDAMLRDFPAIATLEMVEAPGTSNDIANLAVGRKIRAAGIATHVPRGGSVRSGAVELFLAGETRSIEDGASFAVHSWLDNHGREADDFAADHPANRLYLDYYVEMGMSAGQARDFYAMTNSVPHASALWLKADEMRGWIAPQNVQAQRYAARDVHAACAFCARVDANVAATNARLAAVSFEPIAPLTQHREYRDAPRPVIAYGNLTSVKLSQSATSLLDS